jgi:hypothetical protein
VEVAGNLVIGIEALPRGGFVIERDLFSVNPAAAGTFGVQDQTYMKHCTEVARITGIPY